MTVPNTSGSTPNAATNAPQSQPANSTAGNTSSGATGDGDATTGTSANGGGNTPAPNANAQPVTFTPEQIAEIERRTSAAAAAARRQAEQQATRERERAEAEARGDVQALLTAEREAHTTTRQQLADTRRELDALTVALEENLPNPTQVAPRLRGNTLDELRADARSFATLLGTAIPRPADPPATPSGGGSPQPPANNGGGNSQSPATNSNANVTGADASAELRSGMYGGLG